MPGLGNGFLLAGLRYFQNLQTLPDNDTPKSRLVQALLENRLPPPLSALQRDTKSLPSPIKKEEGVSAFPFPARSCGSSVSTSGAPRASSFGGGTAGFKFCALAPARSPVAQSAGDGSRQEAASKPSLAPATVLVPTPFGAACWRPSNSSSLWFDTVQQPSTPIENDTSSSDGVAASAQPQSCDATSLFASPVNLDTFWEDVAANTRAANEARTTALAATTRVVAVRTSLEVRASKEADQLREATGKVQAIATFWAGQRKPKAVARFPQGKDTDPGTATLLGKLASLRHRVEQGAVLRATVDRALQVRVPATVDLPDLAATSPYTAFMGRICSGADGEAWSHGLTALRDEQQALAEALQTAIAKQRRVWDGTDVPATVAEIKAILAEIDRLAELLGSQGVGEHKARGNSAEDSRQAAAKLAQFDTLKPRHDHQLARVDRCRTRVQQALMELAASFEMGANEMAGVVAAVELRAAQVACDCAIRQCAADADTDLAGDHESALCSAALAFAWPIKAEAARLAQRQLELNTWEEARELLLLLLSGGGEAESERSAAEAALLTLAKLLLELRHGTGKHVESTWMLPRSARSQAESTRQALLKAQQAVRETDDAGLEAARDARDLVRISHLDALSEALNSGPAGSELSGHQLIWPPRLPAGLGALIVLPSLSNRFHRIAAEREVQQPGGA